MSLKETILSEVKVAMKAGEKSRVRILRMLTAAIKQKEVDERIELDETETLMVLEKMLKQRRDALKQYQDANRDDLAEIEQKEIDVLTTFMPKAFSESELNQIIADALKTSQASSMKDMGKIMGLVRPQVQGRADMAVLSQKIKDQLN